MKEFRDKKIYRADFSDIKKNLDPGLSYIVFEKKTTQSDTSLFFKDMDLFQLLEKNKIQWKLYFDEKKNRKYLLTEFTPGSEEALLGYILIHDLPHDTTYYLFKAKQKD
ncbi:MAG: hypothetical protein R6U68_10795 [Desulfobacteraceae bacterium]